MKSIRYYFQLLSLSLKLVFLAALWEGVVLILLLSFSGSLMVAVLGLTKSVVDRLSQIATQGISAQLFMAVGLLVLIFAIETIIAPWIAYFQGNLNVKLTAKVHTLLMDKTASIADLSPFEDPNFYDDLQVLREQAIYQPLNLLIFMGNALRELISVVGTLILLFTLAPFFPILLLIATFPQAILNFRLQKSMWEAMLSGTSKARRMSYFAGVLLKPETAKEVRLFNLLSYFRNNYNETFQLHYSHLQKARWDKTIGASGLVLLSALGVGIALYLGLRQVAAGLLSIGGMVLLIQAIGTLQQNLLLLIQDSGMLYESLLYFERLNKFLNMPSVLKEVDNPQIITDFKEISFDDLSFSYPDGRKVLKNISFSIKRGEKFAIVGENGAGKTTLIKLLLRFYDPSEGKILIDGLDLREIEINSWRKLITAVFQDFGKYALSIKENVALGEIDNVVNTERFEEAVIKGGAAELVEKLGAEQQLFRDFDGTELSLGEWQRLAISRAFYRNSNIMVLDEPTASLDPKEEAHLYKRFIDLAEGHTVLLVTHRLASVQISEQILVLKEGRLVEQGSHEDLLKKNKIYAELWDLQAEAYKS